MAEPDAGDSFLECVHDDVFEIITRSVSENSHRDLLSLRAASKTLGKRLRDYSSLLKYLNIESLLALPELSRVQMRFVTKCEASGNLEASFWLGVYALLKHDNWGTSSELLKAAAAKGHVLSKYACGLFAIAHGMWDDEIERVLRNAQEESLETIESLRERLHQRFETTPAFRSLVTRRQRMTRRVRRVSLVRLSNIIDRDHLILHQQNRTAERCQKCYWAGDAFSVWWDLWRTYDDEFKIEV